VYDWLLPLISAPFFGSFLGVVIERLPHGRPVGMARSACDACGQALGFRDLVPIGSYIFTQGKCRHCRAPIGRFHLLVELAALGVAIWAVSIDEGFRLWADCGLGWVLLTLAWIDARHMILPDLLTLPLVLAGLGVSFVLDPGNIIDHAAGAAVGFLLFLAVARTYRALRGRDGLGEGDAKLLAASGAWVTWAGLADVIVIAALAGIGVALFARLRGGQLHGQTAIPFGPCLAFATWLVWLYGAVLVL
jgi:leader peptidase (prepilin peptidase)/N-methyltransferase